MWPISERFSSFPKQAAYNTVYSISNKPKLYNQFLHVVHFLYHLIFSTVTCFMLAKILISLKKRRRNATLKISNKFEQNLHQMGVMVAANGIVYLIFYYIHLDTIYLKIRNTMTLFGITFWLSALSLML